MVLTITDEKKVHNLIKKLKNKKSTGLYGIRKKILKCCSSVKEKFSIKSLIICLEDYKVPQCMKFAKVIPLFRKRDRNNPENYRPISLLTSVSQLFEKML